MTATVLPEVPSWLLDLAVHGESGRRSQSTTRIREGQRNDFLYRLARSLRAKGIPESSYAEHDLEYVEACETRGRWSLVRYDLRILRRTIGVIARGEGLNY